MQRFLQLHSIRICQRPERSSNKNGRVERQNGLFKNVIEKIERHEKYYGQDEILARESFLKNNCHGSKKLVHSRWSWILSQHPWITMNQIKRKTYESSRQPYGNTCITQADEKQEVQYNK